MSYQEFGRGGAMSGRGGYRGGVGGMPNPGQLMHQIQELQDSVRQLQAGGGGPGGPWGRPSPFQGGMGATGFGHFMDAGPGPHDWPGSGPGPQDHSRWGGGGRRQRPDTDNADQNAGNQGNASDSSPGQEGRILLVSNVPLALANPDALFYAFERFGTVERIKVLHNKRKKAVIQMATKEEADRTIKEQAVLNRTGTDMFVSVSSKFREIKFPPPGSFFEDEGMTKDYTGKMPQPPSQPNRGRVHASERGLGPHPAGPWGGPPASMWDDGGMGGMEMPQSRGNSGGLTLLVSNLPEQVANCESVFNMFGAYGDVVCVKILRNKRDCAMVQMAKPHHAQQVRNYLDQAKVGGNKITISNSKVTNLLNKKIEDDQRELHKDFSHSRHHRFRNQEKAAKLARNMCIPTSTLHIANIPEGLTHQDIKAMFIAKGFTVKESVECVITGGDGRLPSMCYLQMDSPDEALLALALMHNYAPEEYKFKNYNGICVSFSAKKIIG